MSSSLYFFLRRLYTLHQSLIHSSTSTSLSPRHPLCVAVMHPKKNMYFAAAGRCALLPEVCALCHVIGAFSQATSEDRHIVGATARVLIQFRGAY